MGNFNRENDEFCDEVPCAILTIHGVTLRDIVG
jgi:hypothetical protein